MGFGNVSTAAAKANGQAPPSDNAIDPITGARIRPVLAPGQTSPTLGTATKVGTSSAPAAPDAILAASQAAIAAGAAAQRQRSKASGTPTLPTPGAPTPAVTGVAKSLRKF